MGENQTAKTPLFSKRCLKRIIAFLLVSALGLIWADYYVGSFSDGKIFNDPSDVPHRPAAVVLGCGKYTQGRPNLYYNRRIVAAVELWQAGKIDAILVSGDNSRKDYDEPTSMKADLVAKGIPAEYITIDYAGFRTLDSVVRAGQIFGMKEYTVISQPFHCQRAIYLAKKNGQSVVGYCAKDVSGTSGFKVRSREVLARTKAVFDIIIAKKPKYLGQQEQVNYRVRD